MKVLILAAIIVSTAVYATSPLETTQKCASASVTVEAYVYSDSLEVVSAKKDGKTVEFVDSSLEARLRNGNVYEVQLCKEGQSMKDSRTKTGSTFIGCEIERNIVICD